MTSFSHSRLSSFEICPLKYKYAYIDNIKVEAEDTIETYLGSRVHEALEKLYRNLQFEKLMSLKELVAFFKREWGKNWKDTIIIVKKEYSKENYRKMGERYIKDYYKKYKPFKEGKVIGLETTDLLPLDDEGKYKFYIRIDRLMDMGSGLYEVHDYKTNTMLPKQEDLDTDRQLAMYSLWVRNEFKDFKKVRLVWHFVAFNKEIDSFRTEEQLEDLRQDVLAKIHEIEETKEFPAKVTRLCNWCLYRGLCPMWKHGQELEAKPENEFLNDPGVKLVNEYVKIKGELDTHKKEAGEKLEKLRKALIAFCEKKDASVVFGSENKISVNEYESIKFPPKNTEDRAKLIEALKKIEKFDEVVELDIYTLAKVMAAGDWDKEALDVISEFERKEKSYRLSVSKIK